jgi:hypothetical protein
MRPETGPDVMEMVAISSSDRRQVGRQRDPQQSSVRWLVSAVALRGCADSSQTSRILVVTRRARAPVLTVELERLEAKFALAGEADPYF